MSAQYHPAVRAEVVDAMRRYRAVSDRLANQFKAELRSLIERAAASPDRFHVIKPGFHRANLKRFPYHFIYRVIPDGIRVTAVRHHRRDPGFGIERE